MSNVIFADNLGRVKVYDKQIWIPTGLEVTLSTPSYDDDIDTLEIGASIPIFVTGFSAGRKAQIQVKQGLDGTFHVLPFGEVPKNIKVSGLAYGASQATPPLSQSAGDDEPTNDALDETAFYSLLVDTTVPPPRSRGFVVVEVDEEELWADKLADSMISGDDLSVGASEFIDDLQKDMGDVFKSVSKVASEIQAMAQLPAKLIGNLKKALGAKEADGQKLPISLNSSDLRCLSIQQLDSIFTMLQSGNVSKLNPTVRINICGIVYTARLVGFTYRMEPDNKGFSFDLDLICTDANQYYRESIDSVVNTRGESTALSRLVDAAAYTGFGAVKDSSDTAARLI